MGIILKFTDPKTKKDYYMEWSTICDTPLTYGLSLKQFEKYYKTRYGTYGMEELPSKLKRVEKSGCSSYVEILDDIINNNRAGKEEKTLTKEQIIEQFCIKRNG